MTVLEGHHIDISNMQPAGKLSAFSEHWNIVIHLSNRNYLGSYTQEFREKVPLIILASTPNPNER